MQGSEGEENIPFKHLTVHITSPPSPSPLKFKYYVRASILIQQFISYLVVIQLLLLCEMH